jgi:DNA-binding transcriptional LysR family regulator
MIAAPLGSPLRMVDAPSYFERHPVPQMPQDLTSHNCINIRLPTYGGQSVWEFDKDRREMRVRVEGQLVINNTPLRLAAVCDGLGSGPIDVIGAI